MCNPYCAKSIVSVKKGFKTIRPLLGSNQAQEQWMRVSFYSPFKHLTYRLFIFYDRIYVWNVISVYREYIRAYINLYLIYLKFIYLVNENKLLHNVNIFYYFQIFRMQKFIRIFVFYI